MWITLLAMGMAALATAAYFILSHRRPTEDLVIDVDTLPEVEEGLPLIAGITNGAIHWHNHADIFENETIFRAMMEDIRAAKHNVHLETFVWTSGELSRKLIRLFEQKVQEGVKVRVLLDAIGAMSSDSSEFESMRDKGIAVGEYRPIKRLDVRRYNNRTHRKILVIDGRVGYTFGHGIADQWLGHAENKHHWRDTGVRLEGPVVGAFQSIFIQDWIEATGTVPAEPEYFPELEEEGPVAAHVVTSTADSQSSVAQLYQLAMGSARKEVIIQNPYFSPDPHVPQLLAHLARRGVAVHLMVPGKHTDAPVVRRAGRRLYHTMLEAGVRIYEYEVTLLHQKIVIVDGKWSHIGSTNFDERSLALNAEIGVGLLSKDIAADLKAAFNRDLRVSRELTLEKWQTRPRWQRLLDWCAYQVHGQI